MGCCYSTVPTEPATTLVKPISRGCTDLPCLLVLVSAWCGLILVAAFTFSSASLPTLNSGYDSFGNTCGAQNTPLDGVPMSGQDMRERPVLFLQDPEQPERALALCVKMCPHQRLNTIADVNRFFAETGSQLCRYDFSGHAYDFSGLKTAAAEGEAILEECPALPVPASTAIQGRCVPNSQEGVSLSRVQDIIAALNRLPLLRQVVGDVYRSWRKVAALIGVSLLLSVMLLSLLQLLTTVVGVLLTAGASVGLVLVTGILWWTYVSLKIELDITPPERILRTAALNETALLTLAIITTISTPLLIWAIVCYWRNMKKVGVILGETARCIYSLPCLLLQPLWTALAEAVLLAVTGVLLVALGSISHLEANTANGVGEPRRLFRMTPDAWPSYTWWLVPVVAIWTAEFLLACQWLITAGAVCRWFFSRASTSGAAPSCPIATATGQLPCHHLGTAALGSFLVTLLRLPRAALNWLVSRPSRTDGSACCSCCLSCWERCVRVVSRNAYAVTAIDGSSFCAAGRAALAALLANAGTAAGGFSASQLALFCGRLVVTCLVGSAGLVWLRQDAQLQVYVSPLVVAVLGAYLTSGCVLGVVEAVAETLLLCYCQDVASASADVTDGGYTQRNGRGYHTSPRMAKLMVGLGAASVSAGTLRQPLQPSEDTATKLETSSFIETDL